MFKIAKFMATKKITINELRSIVKQAIKEESDILNANFRGVDSNNKLIHVDVDLLYEESEDEIRFTIQQNQFNNQMGSIGIVRIKKQGRNLSKLQDVLREVLKNKFPFLAFNFKTITAIKDYSGEDAEI